MKIEKDEETVRSFIKIADIKMTGMNKRLTELEIPTIEFLPAYKSLNF